VANCPFKEQIIRQVNEAHIMSITDMLRVFFEEIKLQVNKKEWDAIKKRHYFAHGGLDFDTVAWRSIIRKEQTFETLFHKIILKLLSYSGNYVDRSTIGFPGKKLK